MNETKRKKPEIQEDLKKLEIGDVVGVTTGFPPSMCVFEGVIDDRFAFMEKDRNSYDIHSSREKPNTIIVDEIWGIMLLDHKKVSVTYHPGDAEYESKKQILVDANQWR
jgi:hypothetical protein